MAKGPRLDLRRLERETVPADTRANQLAPGGKPITGVMEVVRENLDALVALKASGRSWSAIAAGLTAQGFRTADGRDLTAANLTGVISSVRRQTARRVAKRTAQAARPDVTASPTSDAARPPQSGRRGKTLVLSSAEIPNAGKPRLSAELQDKAPAPHAEPPLSEAEIHRLRTDKHRHLFKKG